jgi:methylenetetrahydrofolate reductase (NADPH)
MNTVTEIIKSCRSAGRTCVSLEVFPPRGELTLQSAHDIIQSAGACEPDFVSVTCSAGGTGDSRNTGIIASKLQEDFAIPSAAHMVCCHLDEPELKIQAQTLIDAGIKNVLALRGDLPSPKDGADAPKPYFKRAIDIIPLLKSAGLCVGAAVYPEGHPDCLEHKTNIAHTLAKQTAGADFLITQLCFDNQAIYRFLDACKDAGVNIPILVGIMPFMSKAQLTRMVFMCGVSLPAAVVKLLNHFEDDKASLRAAGIEYACKQLDDLAAHGVDGLHIYTMNRGEVASSCASAIRTSEARKRNSAQHLLVD